MANLTVFALCLVGLICVQAIEIRTYSNSPDNSQRNRLLQRLRTKDSRCLLPSGIFGIPGDCVNYVICRFGRALPRKCPEGMKFDTISMCTFDESADCGIPPQHGPPKELCLERFGVFVYEEDCHKYVFCTEGKPKIKSCPEGQVFYSNAGCLPSDSCPEDFPPFPQRKYQGFQCTESGRFENPNGCDNYIQCSVDEDSVETTVVACPPEQHYNSETQQCEDKCSAQCDDDLACTCNWPHCLITCPKPNGLFPVPSTNCRKYLECINSIPRVRKCPPGLAFDPERKECVDIEETNCTTASNDLLGFMRD